MYYIIYCTMTMLQSYVVFASGLLFPVRRIRYAEMRYGMKIVKFYLFIYLFIMCIKHYDRRMM